MILPPDVPEPTKTLVLASQVRIDMENAMSSPPAAQLQFTEEQVNAYLASALKTKQSVLNKPLLEFKRGIVAFREGACTVTAERSFFGFSLYSSCAYSVSLADGKIAAKDQGGSIGRMPLHPKIMEFADVIFADVWSALDRDVKLVAKFSGIEFHDKSALLTIAAGAMKKDQRARPLPVRPAGPPTERSTIALGFF